MDRRARVDFLLLHWRSLRRRFHPPSVIVLMKRMRIIGTKAATIQGIAAQMRVLEKEEIFTAHHDDAVNKRVICIARNIRRLAAIQSA